MNKEKTIIFIGLAIIISTVLYGGLAYGLWFFKSFKIPLPEAGIGNKLGMIFSLVSLSFLISARPIREKVWNMRKKTVVSQESFYAGYTSCVVLEAVILESVAVLGLVLFMLTGDVKFSLSLIVISLLVQIVNLSAKYNIEQKKEEFIQFFYKG